MKFTNEMLIQGWCPEELMHILNDAVTKMSADEHYLEIGSFCGRSLAAALKDNDKKAIVIDPLDLWTGKGFIYDIFSRTVSNFVLSDRVTIYRTKAESFSDPLPAIGVFFYDGNHDTGHTYEALKKYLPFLANKALIVVDDYNIYGGEQQIVYPGYDMDVVAPVKSDTERWITDNSHIITSVDYYPWLNGQAVIEISK